MDREVRRRMIEPDRLDLSIGKQCHLLSISRSSFYYSPLGETHTNLALMRLIDKQCPRHAVLRCSADDLAPAQRRSSGEREAHPAADAPHGADADLSGSQHQQAR